MFYFTGILSRIATNDRNGNTIFHSSTGTRRGQRSHVDELHVRDTGDPRPALTQPPRLEAIHESHRRHGGHRRASHRLHRVAALGEQTSAMANSNLFDLHIIGMVGELCDKTKSYR